jgi:hypothetical protein
MLTLSATDDPKVTSPREADGLVVSLRYQASAASSERAPITVGIPVAEQFRDVASFEVHDPISDWTTPCQVDWSPDRTWLRATFLSPPADLCISGNLLFRPRTTHDEAHAGIVLNHAAHGVNIKAGDHTFRITAGSERVFDQVSSAAGDFLKSTGLWLDVATARGNSRSVRWQQCQTEEAGALRSTVRLDGKALGLKVSCRLSFYAGASYARCEFTLHNPRRARHRHGYWDLGDPGSMLFREVALVADLALADKRRIDWREQPATPWQATSGQHFDLYQESSGGENWRSPNHVNRAGQVPLSFRGYRVTTQEGERRGNRASPVVSLSDGERTVTCAVEEFWQKFPTAIRVNKNTARVELWPGDFPDLHELQAGECCTRVVWLDFGGANKASDGRLAWVYDPPLALVEHSHVADSGRVPYFPRPDAELRPEYEQLLSEAIAGPRNFFAKRETIDEYSWRNFGDMWADHEEAYADDPRPVISHYNNQYDLLHGLLIQYLRTSDRRWWELADPLARHVMDIDVYRTSRDKPAYNNGLFWHTAHYHAVGRATHRSMSTTMRGKRIPAPGGGPGNEHNYSSGLLLYHHLTGCPRAKETVVQLGDWVLAMDDGRRHLLGLASSRPTGLASCTTDPEYHGPGRGAGNSIQSLLNAWKLTTAEKYLDHAAVLIRRTIHPRDDIAARQLGNAELRWSYTVYLQALDRFLLETEGRDDLGDIRAYARQALFHYARWMCQNEKFYLDEPQKLEYPTETWAAQELRKGTTLLMAARLSPSAEAGSMRQRAEEILDRAWQTLMTFESRTCTRPLALVLQQGHLEVSLRTASTNPNTHDGMFDFGQPSEFVSQKQHVKSLCRSPRLFSEGLSCALQPGRWLGVLSQFWFTERVRRWFD